MGNATSAASKLPTEITAPHFSIITKALGAETDDIGRRRFHATASSTITDRQGHAISLKALQQMAETFSKGVTIFTDHKNEATNAFGMTDRAELIQRGHDPKSGNPIWDLDIFGIVNEPNPNAVQLHASISGGYVQLGCSIDAFVTEKPIKQASGGLLIDGIDVFAASIVGVPANQRSWVQKAMRAVKSVYGDDAEEDESMPPEITSEASQAIPDGQEAIAKDAESTGIPLGDGTEVPADGTTVELEADPAPVADEAEPVAKATTCPTCGGEGPNAVGDCKNEYHSSDEDLPAGESTTKSTNEDGQEADPAATPETASAATDEPDPAEVRKDILFDTDDVVELVKNVRSLVGSVGQRDETIAALTKELAEVKVERDRLASENKEAAQVIEKVMRLPLRPKTVGYVADLSKQLPQFLAPEVRAYLSNTAGEKE